MANALDRAFQEVSARLGPFNGANNLPVPDVPQTPEWDGLNDEDPQEVLRPMGDEQKQGRSPDDDPLSDDEIRSIDGGIREYGMEVLAFYKSFRFSALPPFRGKWGIFYLKAGIRRVKQLIESYQPDDLDVPGVAIEFLRRHERIHFKVDVYALGLESALSKHLYEPLKQAFLGRKIFQVEEGLANNEAWRWARMRKGVVEKFAWDFMSLQPGGYGRFDEERDLLASEFAANLIDLNLAKGARRDDQILWAANLPAAISGRWQRYCPEYEVAPSALSRWINPAWKLPVVKDVREDKNVLKLLQGKYANYIRKWEQTKRKLVSDSGLPGLDFKRWDERTGHWSVRIDRNFRAHLLPINQTDGIWMADEFGPHEAMGH